MKNLKAKSALGALGMNLPHHPLSAIPWLNGNPAKALLARAGFTLVELLVAISVFAIIAATAAPSLNEWNANRKLMRQARNLYSAMQQAKLEAIRNNCDVAVDFDLPGSYQVFLDNGAGANAGNQTRDSDETIVITAVMENNIAMQIEATQFGGTTTSGFTSRGLPLGGLTGNVVLRRNGLSDRWYRVALAPSGQLTLQISSNSTNGVDGTWN